MHKIALIKCDFGGASFLNSNLSGTVFQNCNLGGADFRGAIMKGINFIDCEISTTKFNEGFKDS